jgi:hypothetical protein
MFSAFDQIVLQRVPLRRKSSAGFSTRLFGLPSMRDVERLRLSAAPKASLAVD